MIEPLYRAWFEHYKDASLDSLVFAVWSINLSLPLRLAIISDKFFVNEDDNDAEEIIREYFEHLSSIDSITRYNLKEIIDWFISVSTEAAENFNLTMSCRYTDYVKSIEKIIKCLESKDDETKFLP